MNPGRTDGGSRRARALRLAALACGAVGACVAVACYSTGDGTAPPLSSFYFPVGLGVSAAGNVLYVANSDFDLQWNGGTVQSYDLNAIRNDTVRLLLGQYAQNPLLLDASADANATTPGYLPVLPWASGSPSTADCPNTQLNPPPGDPNNPGARLPVGEACAPPMLSSHYWRDSVIIGAFATDLQLSNVTHNRIFVPVRGDATLTWMDVADDSAPTYALGAKPTDTPGSYPPFSLVCDRDTTGRCGASHHAGTLNDPGNTRQVAMPGEPFGMAQSEDGVSIAITHQTQNETSLFLSGVATAVERDGGSTSYVANVPSIQYVLSGMPLGGTAIAAVPHDPSATSPDPGTPLRPAFLQTSNSVAEVDLLRYYSDEGFQGFFDGGLQAEEGGVSTGVSVGSSVLRPFLIKEVTYPVTVNASGTDSRGVAIDDTPRRACEQAVLKQGKPTTDPDYVACTQIPSRVFIANRAPASLILGQIGGPNGTSDVSYDPDALQLFGNVPLTNGPSNVYLAPIVDSNGNYALRVFIVCFDTQIVYVWDPDAQRMENIIRTGAGPFAMAFDPFDMDAVARHDAVPFDSRAQTTIQATSTPGDTLNGKPALRNYRFAYLASFTDSFVQVIDLDQSFHDDRLAGQSTWETIVYTLGVPTQPKGSQ